MKKSFLTSVFFIFSFYSFAQFNHQVNVQTGFYNNQVVRFTSLVGTGSYDHQNSFSLGIGYQYYFNDRIALKPEIHWQNSLLTSNSGPMPGAQIRRDIALETINIPILFSYSFNDYFFIDAGPVLHYETHNEPENYIDSQSGIGFSLGLGIQYEFSGFTAFGKPNIQMLSLLPFQSENYHQRLMSSGFIFGLGYNF